MKPASRNRFLAAAATAFRSNAIVLVATVLGAASASAEDLTFSGTGTVRMLASDWIDYTGGSGNFNGGTNDGGRLYWRGSSGDGQYMHFNLSRLSGLTVSSDAAVTLQNSNATWGGGVDGSFIATSNGAWTAAYGAGVPGATAIGGATNATGTYGSGVSISWSIGSSTFQNYVNNASSFNGLAVIGGSGSQMHFNGPMNPYLTVTTNAPMTGVVTVAGGASWNASNYSFTDGVLSINDAVAAGTSGAGAVTINALGTVAVKEGGDNRYWAIDSTRINTGGVLTIQGHSHLHNLTLAGGELAGIRPNANGGWTFDDATTVTGGVTSTISAQQINLDNANFTVDAGSTLNVTGTIRSGGTLTKNGAGTMSLTNVSGHTGGTVVNQGKLVLASTGGSGRVSGALTVNANGTVETTGDGTGLGYNDQISSVALNGGTLTAAGSMHIWNITGGITMTGGLLQSNNGTSTATGPFLEWNRTNLNTLASSNTATIGGRIRIRDSGGYTGITFDVAEGTATTDLLVSASITEDSGGRGITKEGAGTMSLTGNNTYTGTTDVNVGVLSLGDGSSNTILSDSTAVDVALNAQVNLNLTGTDVVGSLILDGTDQGPGYFDSSNSSGYLTGSGKLFVAGGAIDDNPGSWSSSTDSYWEFPDSWGSNTIASGSNQTATFAGATGTTVSLAGDITIGNLSFSGANYTITTTANKLLTLDAATPTIFVDTGRTATIGTRLTSIGTILKTGGGTLVLTGINTSSDGITINGGTLQAARSAQDNGIHTLGSGPLTINNGGTLRSTAQWSTSSEWNVTTVGSITINQGGAWSIEGVGQTIRNGLFLNGGSITATVSNGDWGALHLKSGVTAGDGITPTTSSIAADTALSGTQTITVESGSQLNYSGLIHNQYGTTSGITKEGDGTLVFTGAKTYTGPTTVNFGTLQLGDGTTNGSTPGSAITNNASLVVNPGSSQNFAQTVSGPGALTKTGTGTLSITGPQSYTGDTIVSGGSLELQNNSASVVYATVNNPGFETPDYTGGGWGYLGNDGVSGGWSFSGGGIGSNGSPWLSTAPEGDQAGFIQINGSISQTITVPSNGDYVVTFKSANRPGYGATSLLTASIGATTVGSWTGAELASGGGFVTRNTSPITLTAGTHTLTFTGTTPSGDTGIAIDTVSVTNAALTNGSLTFQPGANTVCNKVIGSGTAVMNGQFYLDLSAAAVANGNSWTLVNHATLNESYGSDFSVTSSLGDFAESPAGTWKRTDGNNTWTFTEGTGVLSLVVAAADPFADWMSTNYPGITSPDNQPGADPDNDGIENILEYVLQGGNPSASNPGILPTVNASGANFVFTYNRRTDATGTTQVFESSPSLAVGSWTPLAIPGGAGVAVTDLGGSIEQVQITVSKGANTKLFGRLKVSK